MFGFSSLLCHKLQILKYLCNSLLNIRDLLFIYFTAHIVFVKNRYNNHYENCVPKFLYKYYFESNHIFHIPSRRRLLPDNTIYMVTSKHHTSAVKRPSLWCKFGSPSIFLIEKTKRTIHTYNFLECTRVVFVCLLLDE